MTLVIVVSVISCLAMIFLVLVKSDITIKGHTIPIYWIPPFIGAVLLICCRAISFVEVFQGITASGTINPIKILILFLSMTLLSVFLDEIGFFSYLAGNAVSKNSKGQMKIFVSLYFVVSLLTVFTSNDIIILTFTPFICYFSKRAGISPIPYLFAEFVAANTWSMIFIIGNPTNMYIATSLKIGFIEYAKYMILPTLFAGTATFFMLWLIFRHSLSKPMENTDCHISNVEDKWLLLIGIIHLGVCIIFLILSTYINIEMWIETLAFAISLLVCVWAYGLFKHIKAHHIRETVKRIPFNLIPFILSMFVLVLALDKVGVTEAAASLLGSENVIFKYGFCSYIASNLINNIPMSVLFSSILDYASAEISVQAGFAAIVGSNVSAFFTPVGALAGIMWSSILKKHKIKLSFLTYIKYGSVLSVTALAAALLGLLIVF